jgi:hypothetical protein
MGSAVPTLLEIQTAMRRGLLGDADATIAATLGDALAPADRLSIYRNTSRTALTNALRLNFPAVQQLVGEDFFAAAADTFMRANHRRPLGSIFTAKAFLNSCRASSLPRR